MKFNELLSYFVEEEHQAIESLLDSLTEEELDAEIAENETIRDRFRHMSLAEFRMAKYLVPDETTKMDIGDKPTKDSLKEAFKISMDQHLKTINSLSKEDLDKEWVSQKTGNRYSYKYLIYHFLEHLATHRGQIAMRVRQIRKTA